MSFQTPITIAEAIDNIEANRYLLPAIQREFVWPSDKIEWLFDSLMRGYPISSFLFWNVEAGPGPTYKFYRFLRKFRQVYQVHNEEASVDGLSNFTAVLDGQQRLTSLWIGLKGSYAFKEKRLHWNDDERCLPTRQLYLNIKQKRNPDDEEDGREFEFVFMKESDTAKADIHAGEWFRVGKILDLKNIATFNGYVTEQKLSPISIEILSLLNPQLDYRNNDFHLDHLHPISGFTKKAITSLKLNPEEEEIFLSPEWNNSIVNLQMLDSNENMSKQDKSLDDWVTLETKKKERMVFLDRCIIPHKSSLQLRDFAIFAKERDALLSKRLSELLK